MKINIYMLHQSNKCLEIQIINSFILYFQWGYFIINLNYQKDKNV